MLNVGNRIVNAWLYPIAHGYVLVDTGYENGFASFQRRLLQQNIPLEHIRYVFLTHAHDDHAGFLNRLLSEVPDLQVVMSANASETLYRGQNSFVGGCTSRTALAFCRLMKLFGKGAHRFPPMERHHASRCLLVSERNREKIGALLGGTILFTPGHTADSLSLLRGDGMLFCGDAAMNGFPSFHRITIWAEDKTAFAQSWETILRAKPARIYPGHGKPFGCGELARNLPHVRSVNLRPLS